MNSIKKIISNVKTIKYLINHRNYNKIRNSIGPRTIRNVRPYVLLCVPAGVENVSNDKTKPEDIVDQLLKGYGITEDKIIAFIKLAEAKFVKACEDYRNLLAKQINIFKNHKDELDKMSSTIWDEVVKYRSEAETLKKEIEKLLGVISSIENQSYDMLGTSSLLGALKKAATKIEEELDKLRKVVEEQNNQNKELEKQLLEETTTDILRTKKLFDDLKKK